jgi:hypothetical protein
MRAGLRDSLEHLFPDFEVGAKPRWAMRLDVARGSVASVNILLNGLKRGGALRLTVRRDGKAFGDAAWFRLVDVPVEVNTGPVGFIEKAGEKNPYVIRRAPFRVYDAMEPAGPAVRAEAPTIALRLHIPVAADARAGVRDYEIEVRCGSEAARMSLRVIVHRATVPPVGRESWPYTNWFSLELMAERHGLKLWSEAHWRMIRRYAELMARVRQNTFWVPGGTVFSRTRDGLVLNRERLRRLVRTFTAAGMHFIEGGHVASRTGGVWKAKTFDVILGGPRATSPAGNADLARACRQLMEEIERNGWRGRWIQHVTDEPTPDNAADYRILVGMVRKSMPGIPILDATMDPTLVGSVDIWCPQAQHFQRHRNAFDAQRALGDRVWFYTCCFPGGPWLNRLMDMELLRPALLGWGGAAFELDGFLHWGLNHYRKGQDPFKQSVVGHGGGNFLPAGDTHVVYPGNDGPWSSVRLEAQREGIEDFELLKELRGRDAKSAGRIIARVFRGFDRYTKDVKVFRAARHALLERLERPHR